MLKKEYVKLADISNVKNFIVSHLKNGHDIIVCFNYKKLYNQGNDGGHVSLVEGVHGDKVYLIDPSGGVRKIVKISSLISAIKVHEKNSGGFWVIREL